jgi:hypothetical protein
LQLVVRSRSLHKSQQFSEVKPESGMLRVPAAMAAGVTRSLLSFEDLYDEVTAA